MILCKNAGPQSKIIPIIDQCQIQGYARTAPGRIHLDPNVPFAAAHPVGGFGYGLKCSKGLYQRVGVNA